MIQKRSNNTLKTIVFAVLSTPICLLAGVIENPNQLYTSGTGINFEFSGDDFAPYSVPDGIYVDGISFGFNPWIGDDTSAIASTGPIDIDDHFPSTYPPTGNHSGDYYGGQDHGDDDGHGNGDDNHGGNPWHPDPGSHGSTEAPEPGTLAMMIGAGLVGVSSGLKKRPKK